MPVKVMSEICKPYAYNCYVQWSNIIEIRDPVTKFTAAKISFGVIYLFAIVSACAVT